jgi:pilus assembly protein CpaF
MKELDEEDEDGIGEATRGNRELIHRLMETVLSQMEQNLTSGFFGTDEELRRGVNRMVVQELEALELAGLNESEREDIERRVMAELTGLGPLEPLLEDPTLSDILINGPFDIWVDRYGRLEKTDVQFDDAEHLMHVLGRIVEKHGRHLEESTPYVDARLPDGSRLHAMIPPLSEIGPVAAIRLARATPLTLEDVIGGGSLDQRMGDFIGLAVERGLNTVFSGGAATGKTTLLNIFSRFIPHHERIVTIEETRELYPNHPHAVALETRLPNTEGKGEVGLRTLVRNSLRMRADRIIVGEVRGDEVFDMLQAMNVGHQGSLTTVHANNPRDAMLRLETLVLLAGFDVPSRAIREMLGAAFDLLIHVERSGDGSRRITSIQEVGLREGGFVTRELFSHSPEDGFQAVSRPQFLDRLNLSSQELDRLFGSAPTSET